jgi:hypothetical protein
MTTRQAKHQAKRRAEGGVSITIALLPNEPETKLWFDLVEKVGSPKLAFKYLLDQSSKSN